jgi:uncharacterized protein with GYD domain
MECPQSKLLLTNYVACRGRQGAPKVERTPEFRFEKNIDNIRREVKTRDFRHTTRCDLNFTERGIREIKDDPKRAQAARDLAKKCGCEIKQIYLTSGEFDVIQIIETANSNNIAKYALANGSLGFVRSRRMLPSRV